MEGVGTHGVGLLSMWPPTPLVLFVSLDDMLVVSGVVALIRP